MKRPPPPPANAVKLALLLIATCAMIYAQFSG